MDLRPDISGSQAVAYSSTAIEAATGLLSDTPYMVMATSACWIRQGTAKLFTCATQANMADTDTLVITTATSTKTYEFDKAGNGVTAGNVQVNISTDTTAATVAARLRTAILASQTELRVVDVGAGLLHVEIGASRTLTVTENVAHASFTVTAGIVQASAASGSMFLPASAIAVIDGSRGAQLGVIRDAADGKISATPGRRF